MKPFDPTTLIQKTVKLERELNVDLSSLRNCCPPAATVYDAKDLKPYIMAAVNQFSDLMNLDVRQTD